LHSKTFLLGAVLSFVLILGAVTADAATWEVDTSHSILSFKVRHLFSKTAGRFEDWSATLDFDPKKLETGSAQVIIQAASVNTDKDQRDKHLRSGDFFEVEKYPTIEFHSTSITEDGKGYLLHGNLTMHGVTKEVAIPFTMDGVGADPWGNTRAGFSGSLTVNRKDFGMVWNKAMDQGGWMLGEDVQIDLEIEAVQK